MASHHRAFDSGPAFPGPRDGPFRNISQFTLGSDWELMLGDSVQATCPELTENEMQTKFALVYKLTDKLRMQLNSGRPRDTSLVRIRRMRTPQPQGRGVEPVGAETHPPPTETR